MYNSRAAGPYEDTRTGPNQVLRPSNVPRTGPNQVLDINCEKDFKRTENQGVILNGIIFSVYSGRGVKIWLVLTMF